MHNKPGITKSEAYDAARKEFYALRREEEIERRAELRRFRQKRIEDELSNDIYDDDAKSLSIRLGGNSTQGRAGHSTRSREHLPPPLRTQPSYASLEVFRSDLDFLTSSVPE